MSAARQFGRIFTCLNNHIKIVIGVFSFFILIGPLFSQKREINILQFDPRFTLRVTQDWIAGTNQFC